jgi:N-acetylneuraminate synthase
MEDIFKNLFVLELANNHWGSVERGKQIIKDFALEVVKNKVRAAIKLQFRDVDNFVHIDSLSKGKDSDLLSLQKKDRYIQKTLRTKLSYEDISILVSYIKNLGCITMATPFDEKSVEWCTQLNISIIKVASSDINDWFLLNKIAETKKPVIISTGGANDKQIDDVVKFFKNRNIPLAINHCVSKYPTEDYNLELNQIDYLKQKYPNNTIGFSTHEYNDWEASMFISYAKGARTWERHIDIPYPAGHEQKDVSKYCSLPEQIDTWFKSFQKAEMMCGGFDNKRRIIDNTESNYLFSLYRGLYLNKDLPSGHKITSEDVYAAIPYLKEINQITSREFSNNYYILNKSLKKDSPLTSRDIQ